jgi:hypothetical protein
MADSGIFYIFLRTADEQSPRRFCGRSIQTLFSKRTDFLPH